jgi:hypothetical protein
MTRDPIFKLIVDVSAAAVPSLERMDTCIYNQFHQTVPWSSMIENLGA